MFIKLNSMILTLCYKNIIKRLKLKLVSYMINKVRIGIDVF
jgi:hypothetical protein